MLSRMGLWGSVLVVSSALVAGCKVPSAQTRTSQKRTPAPAERAQTKDWPPEKVAQAHAHYAAGVIHEINDEREAALQEYYTAALNDPENEGLVLEVTRRFIQNKQPEKALEILKGATARPQASGPVFARLGLVYAQLGKTNEAVAADRIAVKRAPGSLAGYQNLFLHYVQGKQDAEALKVLDQAASQAHPDVEFLIGLSELYASYALHAPAQKEKVVAKALTALSRAEKQNPASAALRLKLADGFNMLGESEKAAQMYLELLKKLPDVPRLRERVHAKLADIYLRGKDRQRAKDQLEAIVRHDPMNAQAYFLLGSIALDENKPSEAADYLSKAVLLSPDSPELEQAYYNLAIAQIELKKTSEALGTLEKAKKRFSQSFALEMLTGMAFNAAKGYAEAVQRFTSAEIIARASNPKLLDYRFYFQFGAACERKGDYEQAEKHFEKCLQLKPDFTEAMNYLGYMWAEHGMKLDRARELIEKAVKAEPQNAAYLDSLGWVLFKLNQPKEALAQILKAIELAKAEEDPTVYDHLGDIYAALKQPDKAREAWRKSLALEASEAVRKKLEASDEKQAETLKPR